MTTTTEIALRDSDLPELRLPALPSLPDTDSWIRAMSAISKLADQICDTSFVPKGLRGDPAAVAAAILTGRELDMPPMTALRHIHVVEGSPTLDAEYKRARVLAAGHQFDIVEWDDQHCKVVARRRGNTKPPLVMEYTIADARKAQLVKERGNYATRPKVMMLARVTTLVCNAIFADVTNGLATTELLESGDEDALADATAAALPAPQPERQPVTAEKIRQRRQTVQGTVTTDPPPAQPAPVATAHHADSPSAEPAGGAHNHDDAPPGSDRHRKLVGAVQGHFKRLGYTDDDRDVRLAHAAQLANLNEASITSLNDLTPEELAAVADALSRCKDAAALKALLEDGVAGEGEDQ